MKFYAKNLTRAVFSHPKENLIILFDLIISTAVVFVLIQNYYFLKEKHDEFFGDDRPANTYDISMDQNVMALFEADVKSKGPMYEIGLKLYDEINATSIKIFRDCSYCMAVASDYDEVTISKIKELNLYMKPIEVYQFTDHEFDGKRLELSEGRYFTKDEFDHAYSNDYVPMIMGSDFKGVFNIGDKIIYENNVNYDEAMVVGFLKEKSAFEYYGVMQNMDNMILIPYGPEFPRPNRYSPKNKEMYKVMTSEYMNWLDHKVVRVRLRALESGYLYCDDETIDVQKEINRFTSKYGFYQLTVRPINGTAYSETKSISERNMLLIGVLALATTVICMISLGGVLYNRSLDDRRTYCIYMSSGIPLWKINISLIMEMIFWMIISLMPVISLSLYEFQTLMIPIWQIALFEIVVIAVSIAPSLRVNSKCNLDLLIRNQMN